MRALTLWPEWAGAILLLGKRVENRSWPPPPHMLGVPLLLHAGRHVGGRKGAPARDEAARALASIPGVTSEDVERCLAWADRWRGHLVARTAVVGHGANSADSHLLPDGMRRWAAPGQIGWLLTEPDRLDSPQPCRGAQGLWPVPPEILARCRVGAA